MANPNTVTIHRLKAISTYGFHIAACGKHVRNNATTTVDEEVMCMRCKERMNYVKPERILNKENR
jgi:hypothetical protein